MGPAASKKNEEVKRQPTSTRSIVESSQYESNNALYSNDSMTRIKQSLKFLYKNNFVSLTFVKSDHNIPGGHKRLLHSDELATVHDQQN